MTWFWLLFTFGYQFTIFVNALNCHTDGGPKEDEMRNIFVNCAKKFDLNLFSNSTPDMKGERRLDDSFSERKNKFNASKVYNKAQGTDSLQSDENSQESSSNFRSSTRPTQRRIKRERQHASSNAANTGQRSQYNPNTSPREQVTADPFQDATQIRRSKNMSTSDMMDSKQNTQMDSKACIVQCFLQDMEMTDYNGFPDRQLVTQGITKDVQDSELKDFLQEATEECFQLIYTDNVTEKCEFSQNLVMCLSEKGRANCDDWKEGSLHF